jgi:hypothetical protein
MVLGVDMRAIRASAAGRSLKKNLNQASMGVMNLPGLQFLRDIDQVVLSAPAEKKLAAKAQPATKLGAAAHSPALIVCTGHFTAARLQTLLHGEPRAYNGVQIYSSSPQGVNSDVALLDESTLLLGDSDSLRGAIDRSRRPNASPSPLLARAASLAAGNDFWLVATAPPSMRPPAGFQPGGVDLNAMASGIRGIEIAGAFHDGLKLAMNLSTKDAESAGKLVRSISAKLKSPAGGKIDAQQAAEFLRKMDIAAVGNQVRVKFAMSQEEMDRAMALAQKMNATRQGFPLPAAPQRPEPGTIKVYGMPEGVLEIPGSPPNRQ